MKKIHYSFFVFLWLVVMHSGMAQSVEMADTLRSEGKFYVVVLCIGLIFIGLAIYLIRLDLKIKQLEK